MIVGLEGGVAAGKSTLRRGLAGVGQSGLKEYMDYIDSSIHPQISDWPILFKTRFFLEIEKARKAQLSEGQRFVDRTYLTLIAHDFARADKRRLFPGYVRLYERHIDCMIHPDKIVFLSASHETRELRASERGISMAGYFTEKTFNDRIRQFFEELSTVIPVKIIETDRISPGEVLDQTLSFLSSPDIEFSPRSLLQHALLISRSSQ